MKTFKDYLAESEARADTPVVGDDFAINIREECLIESYVVELAEDGIVIEGDDRTVELLEQYGYLSERIARYGAVGSNRAMGYTLEDQDAEVLAQKEIAARVTEPMPGVHEDEELDEAEYQGRKVKLGKPFLTPDGPKKRSVYVRNPAGNVVKVSFGQKGVKIKKSNPERRRSFRARHNCKNPGPRHKARYWSCKFW